MPLLQHTGCQALEQAMPKASRWQRSFDSRTFVLLLVGPFLATSGGPIPLLNSEISRQQFLDKVLRIRIELHDPLHRVRRIPVAAKGFNILGGEPVTMIGDCEKHFRSMDF